MVFGMTYVSTVATFPQAIFFVAMGVLFLAFILLVFVRFDTPVNDVEDHAVTGITREEILVDTQVPIIVTEGEGGRKPAGP